MSHQFSPCQMGNAARKAPLLPAMGGALTALIFVAATAPSAAASGGWLAYTNTRVGRSCTLGSTSGAVIKLTETTTLDSLKDTGQGTELVYTFASTASSAYSPATTSKTVIDFTVTKSGEVSVTPDLGNSVAGWTYTYKGVEYLPSITSLAASGAHATSEFRVQMTATTAATKAEAHQMVTSGDSISMSVKVNIAVQRATAPVVTPGGTFSNVLESSESVSIEVSNLRPQYKAVFSGITAAMSAPSHSYYASGTGLVKEVAGSTTMVLTGCKG